MRKRILCSTLSLVLLMHAAAVQSGLRKGDKDKSCQPCTTLDGFVSPDQIRDEIRKMVGKYKGGRGEENVEIQKRRGVTETFLVPNFIDGGKCPTIDSEKWAINYSFKRKSAALHKGIDIPQPEGTPILAIADGMVVGKFLNKNNKKGIEIVLRHTPEQTGLSYWTYSQYTHLKSMSPLPIGARVEMGDEIGKTSNSGKQGKRRRRNALHFAVLYSEHPQWSNDGVVITPKDSYFMDPNAFYRLSPPYSSKALRALPKSQKRVSVPYMKSDSSLVPNDTKRIWPYRCK